MFFSYFKSFFLKTLFYAKIFIFFMRCYAKMRWILLLSLVLFLVPLGLGAPQVELRVKEVFEPGDVIGFEYRIEDEADSVEVVASAICDNLPSPNMSRMNVSTGKWLDYTYGMVDSKMPSSKCSAIVYLTDYETSYDRRFEIRGKKMIEGEAFICKEKGCLDRERIFYKGDTVYFNFSSSPDVDEEAYLVLPDGASRGFDLPSGMRLNQVGWYELVVKAEKEGYVDYELKESFSVLDNAGEEVKHPPAKDEEASFWVLAFMGILIVVIILILIALRKRK